MVEEGGVEREAASKEGVMFPLSLSILKVKSWEVRNQDTRNLPPFFRQISARAH